MMTTKTVVLAASCLLFAACSIGMHETLGRTNRDPFQETPSVTSFNGDFSIAVNWSYDEAADEYYLFRAKDDTNPQYHLIYRGIDTEFRDAFFLQNEEELHLYRLGKRRGDKLFVDLEARGRAGLGVVSGSRRDFHGPNDTIEQAAKLSANELFANSWFFQSNYLDGISIVDHDWYYIDIPPQWMAIVIITDSSGIGQNMRSHFNMDIWGEGSREVFSEFPKHILNTTDFPKRVFIRISPDFPFFRSHYMNQAGGGYGAFVRYTIKISSFNPI